MVPLSGKCLPKTEPIFIGTRCLSIWSMLWFPPKTNDILVIMAWTAAAICGFCLNPFCWAIKVVAVVALFRNSSSKTFTDATTTVFSPCRWPRSRNRLLPSDSKRFIPKKISCCCTSIQYLSANRCMALRPQHRGISVNMPKT